MLHTLFQCHSVCSPESSGELKYQNYLWSTVCYVAVTHLPPLRDNTATAVTNTNRIFLIIKSDCHKALLGNRTMCHESLDRVGREQVYLIQISREC